jgi:hypothetical protein
MEPQVLEPIGPIPRWRNALVWVGLLSAGVLAIVLALYLSHQFQGRIPAINWLIAVLAGFTTLGLLGTLGLSRATLKEASLIAATGAVGGIVGLSWGPQGIFVGLVVANIATSVVAWRKRRVGTSPNKSLERTGER